jgi:hypothetical protein
LFCSLLSVSAWSCAARRFSSAALHASTSSGEPTRFTRVACFTASGRHEGAWGRAWDGEYTDQYAECECDVHNVFAIPSQIAIANPSAFIGRCRKRDFVLSVYDASLPSPYRVPNERSFDVARKLFTRAFRSGGRRSHASRVGRVRRSSDARQALRRQQPLEKARRRR